MKKQVHPLVLWVFLLAGCLNAQQQPAADFFRSAPSSSLSAFNQALDLTSLGELLKDSGPYTVFAPSNAAFDKLGTFAGEGLAEAEYNQKLRDILAYHIVAGELTASRILKALCRGKGIATFTTILGEPLLASIEGTDIILTDCLGNRARIVQADTARESLLYHEIDTVVLPSQTRP